MDQVAGHTSSIFRVPAYRGEAGGGVQALAEGRTGYVSPDRARDPLRSGLLRGVHPGQKQEEEMKRRLECSVIAVRNGETIWSKLFLDSGKAYQYCENRHWRMKDSKGRKCQLMIKTEALK